MKASKTLVAVLLGFIMSVTAACGGGKSASFDWKLAQTLASEAERGGLSTAIAVNGDTMAVHELQIQSSSLIYGIGIFNRENGEWIHTGFTPSVVERTTLGEALAYNGNVILANSPDLSLSNIDYAFVFDSDLNQLSQLGRDSYDSDNSNYGSGLAITEDTLFVGASLTQVGPNISGVVFVYNESYEEIQAIQPESEQILYSGSFGEYIAAQGDTLAVYASTETVNPDADVDDSQQGVLYIYIQDNSNQWTMAQRLVIDPTYGFYETENFSITMDGDTILLGYAGSDYREVKGRVYVFTRNTDGEWGQTQTLEPSGLKNEDLFATALAISGDMALVGAPGANTVYVYQRDDKGTWSQAGTYTPPDVEDDDGYGAALALTATEAFIGSSNGNFIYVLHPSE